MYNRDYYYNKLYEYYMDLYKDDIVEGHEGGIESCLDEMQDMNTYELRDLYESVVGEDPSREEELDEAEEAYFRALDGVDF